MPAGPGRPRPVIAVATLMVVVGIAGALSLVGPAPGKVVESPRLDSPGTSVAGASDLPSPASNSAPSGQTGTNSGGAPAAPTAGNSESSIPLDPASNGRIAIVDAAGTLFSVAPDGTDRRQLGTPGRPVIFPAWSPDGQRLAAIGADNAPGVYVFTDRTGTAIVGPLGTGPSTAPIYLAWSPSGTSIAYLANQPPTLALHIVAIDGTTFGRDRVIRTGQPMYWAWAADSGSLLVHAGQLGADEFTGHLDVSGGAVGAAIPSAGPFGAPGISRAGDLESYATQTAGGDTQLVLAGTRAGAGVALRVPGAVRLGVDPTGAGVAWISAAQPGASPTGPMHLLDAASGSDRVLVADAVVAFFWSPDGRHIAVLTTISPGSGAASARVGEMPAIVATSHLGGAAPATADGEAAREAAAAWGPRLTAAAPSLRVTVVDVNTGDVTVLAELSPAPLFAAQFLPFFDQYAASHSIWSPHSDAIVLPAIDDAGQAHISVVPIDGRSPLRIADGVLATWSP